MMQTLTLSVPIRAEHTVTEVATALAGGATVWHGHGTYVAIDGTVEREPVTIVMVSGSESELGTIIGEVARYLQSLGESAAYCDIAGRGYIFSLSEREPLGMPACAVKHWHLYRDTYRDGRAS